MNRSFFPLLPLFLLFSLSLAWAEPTAQSGSTPKPMDLDSWRLQTLQGATATLTKGTDGPSGKADIAVEAQTAGSGEAWLVQIDYPISLQKGKTYHLKFMAKASPERYVFIGCTAVVAPYASLTEGKSIQLSDDWQQLEYDFTPKADESEARILLTNLNEPGAKYYLADMTLD